MIEGAIFFMKDQASRLIEKAEQRIQDSQTTIQKDPYRLTYHLMPPAGLLNDPNGCIQFNGLYHVFFQWNPFDTTHGSKYWGHYTSPNLVDWKLERPAIAPDQPYDINGCYSGSAIEYDGKLFIFYTGNVKRKDGGRESTQCLAVSTDGIHFDKKGPIIKQPYGFTAHFRDPKVWRKDNHWLMVIGARDKDDNGCVVLYRSDNLYDWDYQGIVTGSHYDGNEYMGYMLECPDLFDLNGQTVLVVCPQGLEPKGFTQQNLFQAGYVTGELKQSKLDHGLFTELDRGFDFYAPQTMLDDQGRRLLIAWLGMTDEQEQLHPTIEYGWVHAMTIPRELELRNGKILQYPVAEMKQLRRNFVKSHKVQLKDNQQRLEGLNGYVVEIMIDQLDVKEAKTFIIAIGDDVLICYDTVEKVLTLKRRNLAAAGKMESRSCKILALNKLHIYLDTSSIEMFVNNGEEVFTARIFPNLEIQDLGFSSEGSVSFRLQKWDLN